MRGSDVVVVAQHSRHSRRHQPRAAQLARRVHAGFHAADRHGDHYPLVSCIFPEQAGSAPIVDSVRAPQVGRTLGCHVVANHKPAAAAERLTHSVAAGVRVSAGLRLEGAEERDSGLAVPPSSLRAVQAIVMIDNLSFNVLSIFLAFYASAPPFNASPTQIGVLFALRCTSSAIFPPFLGKFLK